MHVVMLIGRYAGETLEFPSPIARAMLADGRAMKPGDNGRGVVQAASEALVPVKRRRGRPRKVKPAE